MIEAKDLRIGNKIRMVGSKSMVNTVFDIADNTRRNQISFESEDHKKMYSHIITVEENGNQYKPFEIEGIPLTEEILIKAGFENHGGDGYFAPCREYFYFSLRNGFIPSIYKGTNFNGVKYLHQLQNLFYSLTGEDLNINL